MSARMGVVIAAVVDNDTEAAKGLPNGLGRLNVQRHILVVTLRPGETAVEGIQHHDRRDSGVKLVTKLVYNASSSAIRSTCPGIT